MLALVAGALDVLGVAGYRSGALLVTLALPVAMAGVAWLLTRHRWAAAGIAVAAVLLAGVLATRAPWSTGRLEAALDDLHNLDGWKVLETERAGHSWCRPDCPQVTRTWDAPNVAPRAAVFLMALSMSNAGLAPPANQLSQDSLGSQLTVTGTKADAFISAEQVEPDELRVTVVLSAHR